ncbi:hypothetical protein Tco_0265860 [Tanacetum coccineum]
MKFGRRELSTTRTTVTTTSPTATIITNHNRIEDRKPSGLMLSLQLKTMGGPSGLDTCRKKGQPLESYLLPVKLLVMLMREKGHIKSVAERTTTNNGPGKWPAGAAPVARAPYRLAPLEMQELSDKLQELAD